MAKYEPLTAYLASQKFDELPMRFSEIERVLGGKLPRSAFEHRPWWANETNGHVHAKAWLKAGFETTQVDMDGRKLIFRRTATVPIHSRGGISEATRRYAHDATSQEATLTRHPLVGFMKEVTTIAPGVNIMDPVYGEHEWNEFLVRKASLIEEGLKRK